MGLPDASVWLCPACSLSMAAQCPWRLQLPRLRLAQCPCPGCACHPSLCSAAPSSQGASGTPSSAPRPNASLHPSLTSWGYEPSSPPSKLGDPCKAGGWPLCTPPPGAATSLGVDTLPRMQRGHEEEEERGHWGWKDSAGGRWRDEAAGLGGGILQVGEAQDVTLPLSRLENVDLCEPVSPNGH